jgi:hypothetical protein
MDVMNKELFQKEWDEYQNKSLKCTFGNSLRLMIDEMHRRINRLANDNPDKVCHFLNSKHREVALKPSDNNNLIINHLNLLNLLNLPRAIHRPTQEMLL